MKFVRNLIVIVVAILVVSPMAHSQDAAVLNNTSMGRDQNDARDYINSLQPGPQKYGKGEKKAQINSAELKSKSIKDATFGGSLMNIGIDSSVPKLDAAKEHAAPTEEAPVRKATSEQPSTASKQTETKEQEASANSESQTQPEPLGGATFSNLSQTALLADDLNGTTDLGVSKAQSKTSSSSSNAHSDDAQKKKTDDKSATDKTGATKPDGDH